jgi:hypothetical protein
MKQIPFVANHPDDLHCVPAVFRMIYQYYFHQDLSWEEIDRIIKFEPGKGAWTFPGELWLANCGLDVLNIEKIDYHRLFKERTLYFNEILGKDTADFYTMKTNINTVIPLIPKYLNKVRHETRKADITEIYDFLKQNKLILAEVNSCKLNYIPGFNLHMVLLYEIDGDSIIIHDPGLPPIPARKLTKSEFTACFDYTGSNGEITVFDKK